jgi:uncharacterized glyoxalase superfamily protein PhnB
MTNQRVIPALRITNYHSSIEFYTKVLGFRVQWEHRFEPHFPVFMAVARDGMQIYLSEHIGDCQVGGLIHFVIDDVDAWHQEFVSQGARPTEPPNDDLGFRNMTITDPDGNQLRFMESSATQAESADANASATTEGP